MKLNLTAIYFSEVDPIFRTTFLITRMPVLGRWGTNYTTSCPNVVSINQSSNHESL